MSEVVAEGSGTGAIRAAPESVGFVRSARVAVWGTLAAVGAGLGAVILGVSPVLWIGGGVGAVVAGLGVVVSAASVLRRDSARLPWRIAGGLGIPFGLSLSVYGLFKIFWRPVAAVAAFDPPLLFRLAVLGLVFLGPVLLILVGADVARFLIRGLWGKGPEDEDSHVT